jgi:hypothetical protein
MYGILCIMINQEQKEWVLLNVDGYYGMWTHLHWEEDHDMFAYFSGCF